MGQDLELEQLNGPAPALAGAWCVCDDCGGEFLGWRGQPTCSSCLADANIARLEDPAHRRRAAEWRERRAREERYRVAVADDRRRRRLEGEQQRHDERAERRRKA